MEPDQNKSISTVKLILAFATVYIVWGSTYFFIQKALGSFPPFLIGVLRYISAGLIMMTWCVIKGEKIIDFPSIKVAAITGLLLLFVGNGIVLWVEQSIPSAMVAIMLSSSPIWFILLDKHKWKENFSNRPTIVGLLIGFAGVVLLFSEHLVTAFSSIKSGTELLSLLMLVVGTASWAGGSLYSKYNATGSSSTVSTAWQMLSAGIAFLPASMLHGEFSSVRWDQITTEGWLSLVYLILFGSIAAFSAYVWLLKVQPASKVSTFAYVNPVIAVLLGIFFAKESISMIQIIGLFVILGSVVLINLTNYKKTSTSLRAAKASS